MGSNIFLENVQTGTTATQDGGIATGAGGTSTASITGTGISVKAAVALFLFAALALQGCGSDNKPTSAPMPAPTPAPMLAHAIMAAAAVEKAVSQAGAELLGHGYCATGIYNSAQGNASSCAAKCASDANCTFFSFVQSEPPTCTFHDSYSCDSRVDFYLTNPDFYLTFVNRRGLAKVKAAMAKAGIELLGLGYCGSGVYRTAYGSVASCAAQCSTDTKCNFFSFFPLLRMGNLPTCTFHDSYSCEGRVQNPTNPDVYLTFVNKRGLAKVKAAIAKVGIELLGQGYCTLGVYLTDFGSVTSCAAKCSTDAKCNFFSFLPSLREGNLPSCTFHDSHSCDSRVQNPTIPDVYLTFTKKDWVIRV